MFDLPTCDYMLLFIKVLEEVFSQEDSNGSHVFWWDF